MKVPHQDWGCSFSTHPVFNFHITFTGDPQPLQVVWWVGKWHPNEANQSTTTLNWCT